MRRIVVIVGLLIGGFMGDPWAAELPHVKELMVVGSGQVVEGDIGKARQDAIVNALREAVRISLLDFIPSIALEENAEALDMEIFNRVTGYVQTFKILSETGKADSHEVLLRAQIDLRKLRDSLSAMGYPPSGFSLDPLVLVAGKGPQILSLQSFPARLPVAPGAKQV